MACDEFLVARIRRMLAREPGITERRMFGGVAFLRHGLMFVGVSGSMLMVRVGKARHDESLAREHVRPMDFTGRPMAGYVFVEEPGIVTEADLHAWLRRALDHVATLPPKPARSPRPPKAPRAAGG